MGYRIKTVAEMTGVSKGTLLAWERRYGFVVPERQENGYREFTQEDVERIKRIRTLIEAGHKVSEAISLVQDTPSARPLAPLPASGPVAPDTLGGFRARYQQALIDFDLDELLRAEAQLSTMPYETRVLEVLLPTLRALGDGWAMGRITTTQEHHASERIREQMLGMLTALGHGPRKGPQVVLAGYPGEQHVLGLLALAVLQALRGHRVVYLGADVPLEDLAHSVGEIQPQQVIVATVMPVNRDTLGAYARLLRLACPPQASLILGGAGLPYPPPEVPGVQFLTSMESVIR